MKVDVATPVIGGAGHGRYGCRHHRQQLRAGRGGRVLVTGGDTDKGNVVVTQVTYHDSTKLTAKVSLTNAKISDFDVKVTLMSGRNGKGISLFKVVAKGGGSGDRTPPAAVSNLTVSSAMLAVSLRFTAPGDDGTTGTASTYDVRYIESTSSTCPSDPDATWTQAGQSGLKPLAGGSTDTFVVRSSIPGNSLTPDTSFCVAIRAGDEVPNYSAVWAIAGPITTSAGDWSISERLAPTSMGSGPFGVQINFAFDGAGTELVAWLSALGLEIARGNPDLANAERVVVPVTGEQVRVAGSASGGFGLVVYGQSAPITYIDDPGLGQPPTQTTVASSSSLDPDQKSSVAFVLDHSTGLNPAVDYVRVDSETGKSKTVSLMLAERQGSGWVHTRVLTYDTTQIGAAGSFPFHTMFSGSDGNPRVVIPYCGVLVYAERDVQGGWHYYDAGPWGTSITGVSGHRRQRRHLDDARSRH